MAHRIQNAGPAQAMLKRYVHVPDEIKRGIADQVGGLLWRGWERPGNEDDDGPSGSRVPA